MRLFIIRHGKARHDSESGLDRDRALATKGRRQAEWMAAELAARIGAPSLMLSSPVSRAKATAEILREVLRCRLEFDERLSTDGDVRTTLDAVASACEEIADLESLLIVGHNPHFGQLANLLAGTAAHVGELRTGECVLVRGDFGGGRLSCEFVERLRLERDD